MNVSSIPESQGDIGGYNTNHKVYPGRQRLQRFPAGCQTRTGKFSWMGSGNFLVAVIIDDDDDYDNDDDNCGALF